MPCLEIQVAALPHPVPATRLRTLLEKPGAAVLRRNYIAEAPTVDDTQLRNRVRVAAVLAVNLTDPPRPIDVASPDAEEDDIAILESDHAGDDPDPYGGSFAKGLEIWIAEGERAVCVHADADEIAGALAMFDAWYRLARFQPAFQRLEKRLVGLHYGFREGLSIGVQGDPAQSAPEEDSFFDSVGPIPEMTDFREPRFVLRLPEEGVAWFHELLQSASAWLEENSYPNILGTR